MRRFLKFHPWALFCFFVVVSGITMTAQSFYIISASLFSALLMACLFMGAKSATEGIWFYILLVLCITLINPFFSQTGKTVLFSAFDRDITKEAVLFGLLQGLKIFAVIFWFRVFSFIFTTDRLLVMFGGYMPKLALTLSMAIRFIPLFKRQIQKIKETQSTLGLYDGDRKSLKIKAAVKVFVSVLAWAPENAIDTYDAMLARGFSGKKITSAQSIKITLPDIALIICCFFVLIVFIIKNIGGNIISFNYVNTAFDLYGFITFAALFFYPSLLHIKENIIWKYYVSRI